MKETKTICDCCGSENNTYVFTIPIISVNSYDKKHIIAKEVDLCKQCANVIMNAYYTECEKHGRSGIIAIEEGDES